jgi:hypothetical protein
MCQSCVEIDQEIERYRELLHSTRDQKEIERINRVVAKLYRDRVLLPVVGLLDLDPALFGYKMETSNDLTFDDRDSAPFMPRCRIIDPAFTWGD